MPASKQDELFCKAAILSDSIVAKLWEAGEHALATKLAQCHQYPTRLTCRNCGFYRIVWNHCWIRWCPFCAPIISARRAQEVRVWARSLKQPKHVVLTTRNTEQITHDQVRNFSKALQKIRRRRWQPSWQTGCYTIELTNEGRGWHLHAHLLIETRWIDPGKLSTTWASIVGQEDFAIVKVKDARPTEYCHEVAKYIAKPTQVAAWRPEEIAAVTRAFEHTKVFGVWGRLYGLQRHWKKIMREAKENRGKCRCGAKDWHAKDERLWEVEPF